MEGKSTHGLGSDQLADLRRAMVAEDPKPDDGGRRAEDRERRFRNREDHVRGSDKCERTATIVEEAADPRGSLLPYVRPKCPLTL